LGDELLLGNRRTDWQSASECRILSRQACESARSTVDVEWPIHVFIVTRGQMKLSNGGGTATTAASLASERIRATSPVYGRQRSRRWDEALQRASLEGIRRQSCDSRLQRFGDVVRTRILPSSTASRRLTIRETAIPRTDVECRSSRGLMTAGPLPILRWAGYDHYEMLVSMRSATSTLRRRALPSHRAAHCRSRAMIPDNHQRSDSARRSNQVVQERRGPRPERVTELVGDQ
jgi:hypothetical protein